MASAYDREDEPCERPAKRSRTTCEEDGLTGSNGHSYGCTTINTSDVVIMGNQIQYQSQGARDGNKNTSDDKCKVLLKSLLFDRIDFRVNNVKKALLSTCEWLFRHPHFRTWYESRTVDEHNGFLWIKGKPGCGKSTLMKAALEWTRKKKNKKSARQTIVPYFFNARASASLEKSSLGLYRTIVHHLLSSYPNIQNTFVERFALKDPGQFGENWTVEELQGFLQDVVESNDSFELYLFIDALDEAEYEDDVRKMISFLIQLSDRASAAGAMCKLRICLSSRHYPHISINRGLSLVVEDQPEHGHDIELYITKELTCIDGPEKDDLRTEMLKKSASIFLWVVLVVDMLNTLNDHGAPLSDMKDRLETIPAGLNELFKEILVKSDHGIETSILFFQWTLFRMRPLEPAELFVAMEHSRSSWNSPSKITIPPPDRLARYFVSCSRGLAEVTEFAPSQPPVIQFIHETVREFLQKENGLGSILPALATNLAGISHEILRIGCIRCIMANNITPEYERHCEASYQTNHSWEAHKSNMRRELPFLDYAVSFLFSHAETAQKHNISQQAFLENQLEEGGLCSDSHRRWWNVFERYKARRLKSEVTLLYFLAEQQCPSLMSILLRISNTVNTVCGRYGSALQTASYYGFTEMVQKLLENGADVDILGGQHWYALQAASRQGHEEIVQILLNAGADVNSSGGELGSPLRAASIYGHENVARILLNAGASLNPPEKRFNSPLQEASKHGRAGIVQLLLEKDDGFGSEYDRKLKDALCVASFYGQEKVVQVLIDAGADVGSRSKNYCTALHEASYNGHEKVVKVLINAGADVNARGELCGRTALHKASMSGREKVVQTLINAGADVNSRSTDNNSALHFASQNGRGKAVQILVDAGADVNALSWTYGTALKAATSYDKIIRILRDAGADL